MPTKSKQPQVPTIAVDEHAIAKALHVSVGWVRKDRYGRRILPFYRLGGHIRYNPDHCVAAIAAVEEGGDQAPKPRISRGVQ